MLVPESILTEINNKLNSDSFEDSSFRTTIGNELWKVTFNTHRDNPFKIDIEITKRYIQQNLEF